MAQKIGTIFVRLNFTKYINRFPKLFHSQNQEKICNNTIIKDQIPPHLNCAATLPCEMSGVLKSNN